MRQFLVHAAITLLVLWAAICIVGPYFDATCVEGKLSKSQVEAINNLPWEKCPGYRDGRCQAEVNDRVVVHECSRASRSVFLWWKKVI